jgi:hypothetical protein
VTQHGGELMTYNPKASKYDPDAAKRVHTRLAADRAAAQPTDDDQAKSILDGLPNWLVLDNWRWMPGGEHKGHVSVRNDATSNATFQAPLGTTRHWSGSIT